MLVDLEDTAKALRGIAAAVDRIPAATPSIDRLTRAVLLLVLSQSQVVDGVAIHFHAQEQLKKLNAAEKAWREAQ